MKVFINIKFAVAAFLASMLSACKVETASGSVADSHSLVSFSSGLMTSYMLNPAQRLFELLSLDEYLKLTDSEKKESKWNGLVFHKDDNTLYIIGIGTLITGGNSIAELDAVWKLTESDYYYAPGLDITVRCVDESVWELESSYTDDNTEVESCMTVSEVAVMDKSLFCAISCFGSQKEKEYLTEFSTGDEKFIYYSRLEPYDISLSGEFSTEIFQGNNLIDYCYMTYSERGRISETSRD